MKKIVFVVLDREVGGVTSALSSLYNRIKCDFNIEIVQLTTLGDADVVYSDVVKPLSWFSDYYYGQTLKRRGWKFLVSVLVKIIGRIFPSIINLSIKRFERYCHKNEINCVIAYGEGAAANFVSKLRNIKIIAWIHYDITFYSYSKADNELYSKFDKIICVADSIAKGMGELYPNLKGRIIGIHNLIDVQRVCNLSTFPIPEQENYLFDAKFTIISIGRICDVKQFHYVPKIASDLKKKKIDFKWIVIGPANDKPQLQRFLDSIKNYGVSDCVVWIGSRKNPYAYLSKVNLLVSTSSTEACPMVFIESRVLRVPIVTNSILTAQEFVLDGKNGYIVPLHKMSEKIEEIINDRDVYQLLRRPVDAFSHNEDAIHKFNAIV